jgi:hypothetical protein
MHALCHRDCAMGLAADAHPSQYGISLRCALLRHRSCRELVVSRRAPRSPILDRDRFDCRRSQCDRQRDGAQRLRPSGERVQRFSLRHCDDVVRLRRDQVSGLAVGAAARGAPCATPPRHRPGHARRTGRIRRRSPTRSASRRRSHQSFRRCRYPMAVLRRARHRRATGRRPAHLLRPVEPLVPARDPAMLTD